MPREGSTAGMEHKVVVNSRVERNYARLVLGAERAACVRTCLQCAYSTVRMREGIPYVWEQQACNLHRVSFMTQFRSVVVPSSPW